MAEVVKLDERRKTFTLERLRELSQLLTSPLVNRFRLGRRAGLTYGGKRDLYEVFGYQQLLQYNDYVSRFERNGIANRIVTAYPQATWRNPPSIFDTDDNVRDSPFEKAWDALNKRFRLFPLFERLDILAGLGEYGCLMIGAPGDLGGAIGKLSIPDNLLYLAPYGQGAARMNQPITDASNPRFGLPNSYQVGGVSSNYLNFITPVINVHYSRIFHVAEGILEGSLFGKPRLEAVWNYLDDLDKVTGGSGEAFWLCGNRGLQIKIDSDVSIQDPEQLDKETQEYIHGFSRLLRLQGGEASELGTTVPDPTGTFKTILACISGTTGIPQRILMGSEAGQLASTQDRDNWNERVFERCIGYAEPIIIHPFIERMVEIGILPEPEGGQAQVNWPDLMAYSAEQKSQQALRESVSEANHANAKVKGGALLEDDEARKRWYGFAPRKTEAVPLTLPGSAPANQPNATPDGGPGTNGGNGGGGNPKGTQQKA